MDIVEDQSKVTTGFFTGNVGSLAGSNLTTASLSTGNKKYYYNLQYNNVDHLSVAFGHLGGSGSIGSNGSLKNLEGETEAIYKYFANLCMNSEQAENGFIFDSGSDGSTRTTITAEKRADGQRGEPGMYFIVAERNRMKDRINQGTWTLQLSGSKSTTAVPSTIGANPATGSLIIKGGNSLENLKVTIGSVSFTVVDPTTEQSMSAYVNTSTQYYIASGSELGLGAQAGGISSSMVHRFSNAIASASSVLGLSGSAFVTSSNTVRLELTASSNGPAYNITASTNNPEQAYWAKSGVTTKLPEGVTYAIGGGIDTAGTNPMHYIKLTDDSKYTDGGVSSTVAGPRFNVISGSAGNRQTSSMQPVFGWFYPNLGLWALRESQLSQSLRGDGGYVTGSGVQSAIAWHSRHGSGLAMDTRIGGTVDNSIKIAKALYKGTQIMRAEEDQTTTSYFCRARAHQFNATNNPSFTSGSNGRYKHLSMEGNPQVFPTTVGLYDSAYNLVAVGRLSKPIQKNFKKEMTVKVNLTF